MVNAQRRKTPKHLPRDFPFELDEIARWQCHLAGEKGRDGELLPPSPGSHMGLLVSQLLRED